MKVKFVLFSFIIVTAALIFNFSTVMAQETSDNKDWEFNLAPFYIWGVTLDGDVTAGRAETSVELDFGDIYDNLEAAFIVHFETLYKQTYGFMFDVNYINIGGSGEIPISEVDLDLESTIAEAQFYYSYLKGPHAFDFMAGVLYSRVEVDSEFSNLPFSITISEDWVDPLVSLRWRWHFADMWGLAVKGGIGGFGVSSDLVWEGLGMLTLQPWKHVQFLLGYRAVGIEYETGAGRTKFVYDVTMMGPVAGINFKW